MAAETYVRPMAGTATTDATASVMNLIQIAMSQKIPKTKQPKQDAQAHR